MENSAKLRAIGYTILYALCMLIISQFLPASTVKSDFVLDIGGIFFLSGILWLVLMAGCLVLRLFVSEEGSWL